MNREDLVNYLDEYLKVAEIEDYILGLEGANHVTD